VPASPAKAEVLTLLSQETIRFELLCWAPGRRRERAKRAGRR